MTKMVLNINGNSNPVPRACTILAINKNEKLGDIAAISVPKIEKASDTIKSCLVVNH